MGLGLGAGLGTGLGNLRALWRVCRVLVHLAHGMAVIWLFFGRVPAAGRHARIGWWSAKLLRLLGLTLQVSGQPRPGATLLIANHVSWLDIAALHAAAPHARFVSKADIKHWPVLGWLVAGAGTLFIEREKKRDALRVVHTMAEALRAGETVAVFPEGTTGPGPELLPFHANLLQAAIATETPVQPALLRFSQGAQAYSLAATFVGDTTLLQSFWRVVSAQGLCVQVQLLPPQGTRHADRRALAAHLRDVMQQQLPPA